MTKNKFQINRLARIVAILVTAFLFARGVWAGDWHELGDLDDMQLSEKILEFQKILDQNCSDYETIKGLGIAYHIKAREDAKKYASRAVEFLAKAHEINKRDYETMCYLGSATTMMAKATWNPIKKMSYVNKGTALMDKAVRIDPDNISVRMTRGHNSKSLPSFLNRGEIALDDFKYLADLIQKNPELSLSRKKDVYINLAELYSKADDQPKAEKYRKLADNL